MLNRLTLGALVCAATLAPAIAPAAAPDGTPAGVTAERILETTDRVRGGGVSGMEWQLKITATDSDTGSDVRKVHVKSAGDSSLAETTFPPRAAGGRLLQVVRPP